MKIRHSSDDPVGTADCKHFERFHVTQYLSVLLLSRFWPGTPTLVPALPGVCMPPDAQCKGDKIFVDAGGL